MTDFYRKFEDKYRGTRESIRERLEAYHPLLLNGLAQFSEPVALDLGCGRGEWLEYITELGYQACGVDQDTEMLEACRQRGLKVTCANLFEHLPQVADQSVHLLTAFHVIEHITFDQLQVLMQQAKRILAPNGLLIFETPNPENISVSCTSFYLDPTHEKPIPPMFMDFMAEYHGFLNTHIARLDNYKIIDNAQPTTLMDVVFYASPDYALITQAPGTPQWDWTMGTLEGLIGHSLDKMVNQFDLELQQMLEENRLQIQALRAFQEQVINSYAWKLQTPLSWLQASVNKIRSLTKVVVNIGFKDAMFKALKKLKAGSKARARNLLVTMYHQVQKRPRLLSFTLKILDKFPSISNRLRRLLYPVPSDQTQPQDIDEHQLSTRGATIFHQLEQRAATAIKEELK